MSKDSKALSSTSVAVLSDNGTTTELETLDDGFVIVPSESLEREPIQQRCFRGGKIARARARSYYFCFPPWSSEPEQERPDQHGARLARDPLTCETIVTGVT